MASSPAALRPQNKRQMGHAGILQPQELNKASEKSRDRTQIKPDAAQSSKRGAENRDPNESGKSAKGVNKMTGVSRLPVLAKTLQPTVKDISVNPAHVRWEERPLLGKAQKRKTCTKPVPFSLSESRPRSQKAAAACSEPANKSGKSTSHLTSFSQRGTETGAPSENPASGETSTGHTNNYVTKNVSLSTATFKLNNSERVNDTVCAIQKDLSTKLRNITLSHSEFPSDGRFSSKAGGFEDGAVCHTSTKQTVLSADCKPGSSEGMGEAVVSCRTPRVSKCPSGPGANVYLPQRVSVKKKKGCRFAEGISENTVPFSPDPSALRSILLNEGIKAGEPDGVTPRVSVCPQGRGTSIYSARRVPIRKPQTHTGTVGEAAGGAVPFSPDPSALRTILHNEGVKHGAVNTPRAFPSGRATSVYSAQRVPVKKAPSGVSLPREQSLQLPAEHFIHNVDDEESGMTFSPDPTALRSILQNEGVKGGISGSMTPRVSVCPSQRATSIYTAQRVPMKKSRAEEVAHTGISRTPAHRVPVSQSRSVKGLNSTHNTHRRCISPGFGETHASSTTGASEQEEEVVQRLFQEEPEDNGDEQMEKEVTSGQTRLHDESSANKLQQGVGTEAEKIPAARPFVQAPHRQSVIVFSSGQKLLAPNDAKSQYGAQLQPRADQTSRTQCGLNSETQISASHGKQWKTKASCLSAAVYAKRRQLEEMFLDEECATYTSRQQSWPAHLRCYNPVASTLLFQDSICFVPIILTCPSLSPVPHFSSPVKV